MRIVALNNMTVGVVCLACLLSVGRAVADSDFVYRPELALSGPVRDTLRWTASLEPQITGDAQQSSEIDLIGGLCWRPVANLSIGPQFMYVTKGANADSNENRPRLDVEVSGPGALNKVSVRGRFEYRMKEGQTEYWRCRGRLKVKLPEAGKFAPFLYDELFYEFGDKNDITGNEGGLGVAVKLAEGVRLIVDWRLCLARTGGVWGTGNHHLLTVFEYSF